MEIINNIDNFYKQILICSIWAILTVYYINKAGRNNNIFLIVVQSGFRLILIGAIAAAFIISFKDASSESFSNAAINFILVLSSAVGANYIAHANMALRDKPNDLVEVEKESKNKKRIKN